MEENIQPQMPPSSAQVPPPEVKSKRAKGKGGAKWILIAIAVILVGAGAALFVMGATRPDGFGNPTPSPTPAIEAFETVATPTPSPSPSAEPADRAEVSIQVLNGTGIAGEAGYLQDQLETLGYETIEAGNATSQDNKETTVTFSTSLAKANVDEITELLEKLYQDVNTRTSASQDSDVEVVTGLRKGSTPLPEATKSPSPTSEASSSADSE